MRWQLHRWLLIAALLAASGAGGYVYLLRHGGSPPKRATLVRLAPASNHENTGLVL